MKSKVNIFINGLLKSYSQIFFSDSIVFAIILIGVSFIDVYAGLAGLLSILVVYILTISLGFNEEKFSKGLYGFNALLVGLGLGIYYQPSIELYTLLVLTAFITFLINLAFEGFLLKYGLPFLSIPFLISMWIVVLATRNFDALDISTRGVYAINELYVLGGEKLVAIYQWWNDLNFIKPLRIYFISLGAIFFQFNVLSGIIIAFGLLYVSRIGFSLSLIGFFAAYYFYAIIGADITDTTYTNIGFNYILTSIAIGGFFLIPSWKSYLWTIIIIPVVAIITLSTNYILSIYQLSVYSLPFNIMVLLFIYILKLRLDYKKGPVLVSYQEYSPEKNLYAYKNYQTRFNKHKLYSFTLPFWGEWTITQAYNGEITHKGKWQHALDFVIKDEKGKTYKSTGIKPEEYYCYGKSVIAPLDGIIQDIDDGIEDNKIGEINIVKNWGNTVIIKHAESLYSQLSHLKPGSIEVKKGDYVKRGQIIAKVGNSGRSPEPHLHFQIQSTPFIGSETMEYPLSHYISIKDGKIFFNEFVVPKQDEKVSNVIVNPYIRNALKFIPGQILKWDIAANNTECEWKVEIDNLNNTYLRCLKTNARAYFINNDQIHYFTAFKGNKKSLLYSFYLALYKVQFGFYRDLQLHDNIPINNLLPNYRLILQDIIAPFYIYLKGFYKLNYVTLNKQFDNETIVLKSESGILRGRKKVKSISYNFKIGSLGIESFVIEKPNKKVEAICVKG